MSDCEVKFRSPHVGRSGRPNDGQFNCLMKKVCPRTTLITRVEILQTLSDAVRITLTTLARKQSRREPAGDLHCLARLHASCETWEMQADVHNLHYRIRQPLSGSDGRWSISFLHHP